MVAISSRCYGADSVFARGLHIFVDLYLEIELIFDAQVLERWLYVKLDRAVLRFCHDISQQYNFSLN